MFGNLGFLILVCLVLVACGQSEDKGESPTSTADIDAQDVADTNNPALDVTEADAGTQPDDTTEADAGTQPDDTTEADAGTQPADSTETDTGTQPDDTTEMDAGTQPDDTTETDTGTQPDDTTEADAGTQPDDTTEADTGTQPDDTTEADTGTQPDGTTEADTGTEPEDTMEADTGVEPTDSAQPEVGEFEDIQEVLADVPDEPEDAVEDVPSDDDVAVPFDEGTVLDDTNTEVSPPEDTGPVACSPALKLEVNQAMVQAFGLVQLQPTGGTGQYQLTLEDNASGAKINQDTLLYMAGEKTGVVDLIKLTDAGCVGEVTQAISVAAPLDVAQSTVTMPPNSCISFNVSGGSGEYSFEVIIPDTPHGWVSNVGTYNAGSKETTEVVKIKDILTLEYFLVAVTVTKDVLISIEPPLVLMPVGTQYQLAVSGGSGEISYQLPPEMATVQDGLITALSPGNATVSVTDPVVGCMGPDGTEKLSTSFQLVVAENQAFPSGSNSSSSEAVSASGHDINGDGYADLVVGLPYAHGSTSASGAVIVYKGTEDGLHQDPVRTISIPEAGTSFGASLTLGDFNSDGRVDLAVGAPYTNKSPFSQLGLLRVYYGIDNGFFEGQPSFSMYGKASGNSSWQRFSHGLAACDFNGDGIVDLAVGAPVDEDPEIWPLVSAKGAVYVLFGDKDGLSETPSQLIYGYIPSGDGDWILPTTNSKGFLGYHLEAGDFNGDQVCDLASSNPEYDKPNGKGSYGDGMTLVYLGNKASDTSPGGLSPYPQRVWESWEEAVGKFGNNFGERLAVGDLNGDGMDDLVVSQTELLMIRIYSGASIAGEPALQTLPASAADVTLQITGNSYEPGDVAVWDITNDGLPDLLVGHTQCEGCEGALHLFPGIQESWMDPKPLVTLEGPSAGGEFGYLVEVRGGGEKDLEPDIFGLSWKDSTLGTKVGLPYTISATELTSPMEDDAPNPLKPLQYVAKASDSRIGKSGSVAFLGDINGDGHDDMAISGMQASVKLGKGGEVFLYNGNEEGIPLQPAAGLAGNTYHYGSIGEGIAALGDFDGNGLKDVAITTTSAGYSRPSWIAAKATNGKYKAAFMKEWSQSLVLEDACDDNWKDVPNAPDFISPHWSHTTIFSGKKSSDPDKPFDLVPTFMVPSPSRVPHLLSADVDFNGDGAADLIMGDWSWQREKGGAYNGGVAVFYGRPSKAGTDIHLICRPDWWLVTTQTSGYMGGQITSMGDLNNDGCGDIAVNANRRVHIIYGFGEACESSTPLQTTITLYDNPPAAGEPMIGHSNPHSRYSRNFALAGGHDVDGDTIADLVIGAQGFHVIFTSGVDTEVEGRVFLVSGAWLLGLDTGPPPTDINQPLKAVYVAETTGITGPQINVNYGYSVGVIPQDGPDHPPLVAVGALRYGIGATKDVGAVLLYEYDANAGALALDPVGLAVGQTYRPGGAMGTHIATKIQNGKRVIAIGADNATPAGSTTQVDNGAVYLFDLSK